MVNVMKRANCIVVAATAAVFTISLTALAAAQTAPNQAAPQKVPRAPQDQETGRSLSGQLNQTKGVVHPPSGVDPGSVQPPPPVGGQSTPVIPPPDFGQGPERQSEMIFRPRPRRQRSDSTRAHLRTVEDGHGIWTSAGLLLGPRI